VWSTDGQITIRGELRVRAAMPSLYMASGKGMLLLLISVVLSPSLPLFLLFTLLLLPFLLEELLRPMIKFAKRVRLRWTSTSRLSRRYFLRCCDQEIVGVIRITDT
jgi:hypothetical protein